jgi:hypothetical protein
VGLLGFLVFLSAEPKGAVREWQSHYLRCERQGRCLSALIAKSHKKETTKLFA